jgi:peptidoglycan/xylan/chitin deacetylase (PgdA/CDA1 family)
METTTHAQGSSVQSLGIILMYHRVTQSAQDCWLLNVSPKHFQEHMEVIKKHCFPIKLEELNKTNPRFNKKKVVLTFDDGYADNFYQAKPILERYEIPATFFVVSGMIDSKEEYWWDELEKIIFEDDIVFPEKYRIGVQECFWPRSTTSREQLLEGLASVLRPADFYVRRDFMRYLRSLNGKVLPRHLPLTKQELIQMANCRLFEIGAHTVTHPTLANMTEEEQEQEISESKEYLEDILNRPIASFAYPYGSYSDLSIEVLKRLKFNAACTVTISPVYNTYDPYQLPRFTVRDWSGDEFERHLKQWLC